MSSTKPRSAITMMMVAGGLLAAGPALSGCAMLCHAMGKGSSSACGPKCNPAGVAKCGAKCGPK